LHSAQGTEGHGPPREWRKREPQFAHSLDADQDEAGDDRHREAHTELYQWRDLVDLQNVVTHPRVEGIARGVPGKDDFDRLAGVVPD
jgi:hypothetical protein